MVADHRRLACPQLHLVVERGEPAVAEIVLELARIERLGIKRPVEPLAPLGVLGVRWVGEDLEQLAVAPGPATVLWWAGAPAIEARRNGGNAAGGKHLLDCFEFEELNPSDFDQR